MNMRGKRGRAAGRAVGAASFSVERRAGRAMASLELIINAVHNRPAIWCSRHPHHKNVNVTSALWQQIQALVPEYGVSELKKKWKNAKDNYRKEVRKMERMKTTIEYYDSSWQYFNLLSFLYVEVSQNGYFSLHDFPYDPTIVDHPANNADILKKRLLTDDVDSDASDAKKKPKLIEIEIGNGDAEEMKSKGPDDYHFLMSLLPHMEKLNPTQKFRLRIKFYEAVMAELSTNDNHFITENVKIKSEVVDEDDAAI